MKSVLKEIIIILLLCCAICLILGIIFYDYIPTNKVIPSTVEAYSSSNTIKEEINQNVANFTMEPVSLEITASDLKLYEQKETYTSGKANPFAASSTGTTGNTTDGNSGTSNNTTVGNNTNPDSQDHFFNNTGLK